MLTSHLCIVLFFPLFHPIYCYLDNSISICHLSFSSLPLLLMEICFRLFLNCHSLHLLGCTSHSFSITDYFSNCNCGEFFSFVPSNLLPILNKQQFSSSSFQLVWPVRNAGRRSCDK